MRPNVSLIGIIGAIALFFGLTSYGLVGRFEAYPVIHLVLGIALLIVYGALSFREMGQILSTRSTRHGANMVISSILFVALLAGINWLGVRYNHRFDLTEEGVFTLSPQARSVVEKLRKDLVLEAFVEGGRSPTVESLLESFAGASSRIQIELIDPDQRPELTEKYGIRNYGEIRVQYGEQSAKADAPTEEALTNAIIKATLAKTQVVYFLQGQGEPNIDDIQSPSGYGQAKADLQNEQYEVKPLLLLQEGTIPEDCDILAVASPLREFTEQEVSAIGNFLDGGGRAIFLLPPKTGGNLEPLLGEFGVRLGQDVVVDQVVRLFQGPALGLEPMVETYGAHPITRDMTERTIFPMTRSVSPTEAPLGLTVTTIANTSPSSWAEGDLETLFEKSIANLDEAEDVVGPISIAVAVTANLNELGRGDGQARLVVYGTAALADNRRINMLFNRDLFLNSFGWLGGEEQLVSIRPRSVRNSRVQFTPEQAATIFYLSVLILPELLLVLGLAIWWRRSAL